METSQPGLSRQELLRMGLLLLGVAMAISGTLLLVEGGATAVVSTIFALVGGGDTAKAAQEIVPHALGRSVRGVAEMVLGVLVWRSSRSLAEKWA